MRIAIDIDSTLHHYWEQFAAAARKRFGVELPYEHQETWAVHQLRPEQVRACVQETHADANVLAAEPYPGAVETVAHWHADGHFIHITSHRDGRCAGATDAWLRRIGLPFDDLHCSYDKIARCRELRIELLIDDAPANIENALAAGMRAATVLHPWNRELCETEDVVCGKDWPELAARLEPLLGGARRHAA